MTRKPQLEPSIIVIFGITGDLSQRYLLPALYNLIRQGLLHEKTEIVGTSRREVSVDEILNDQHMLDQPHDESAMATMRSHTRMLQMNYTDKADYQRLHEVLEAIETEQAVCMNRLYYLSIPPQVYGPIISLMGETGLNTSCQHGSAMTRLLIEKPFGYDLHSALELISETGSVFGEEQIYRIDHYLAKETVQNILTFRFQNPIFEAIWNNQHISGIEISASEQIGIEGRANFYEPIGALRDFLQSHLSQVMGIITMDQPEILDSDHIHERKQAVLEQVMPIPSNRVNDFAIRMQYEGYKQEVDNSDSNTETYAAIRVQIDNDRWRGVPITLWTGKSLNERKTEIKVTFSGQGEQPNELRFRIQPNDGIALDLLAKKPGFDNQLQVAAMDFSYDHDFQGQTAPDAYQRVLVDAVRGDHTLFATDKEVLAAWRIMQPALDQWAKSIGMNSYPVGSKGEDLAHDLHGLND